MPEHVCGPAIFLILSDGWEDRGQFEWKREDDCQGEQFAWSFLSSLLIMSIWEVGVFLSEVDNGLVLWLEYLHGTHCSQNDLCQGMGDRTT